MFTDIFKATAITAVAAALVPATAPAHHGGADTTFGTGGPVGAGLQEVPGGAHLTGVRPGPNNTIVTAGTAQNSGVGGIFVARRQASGALDPTFNNSTTGSFTDTLTDVYPTARRWNVTSLQPVLSGKVRVTGELQFNDGSPTAVFVGGWTANGFRDGSFAPHGVKVLRPSRNDAFGGTQSYAAQGATAWGGGYALVGHVHEYAAAFWFPTSSAPKPPVLVPFPGFVRSRFTAAADNGVQTIAAGYAQPTNTSCVMAVAWLGHDGGPVDSIQGDGRRTIDLASSYCEIVNAVDVDRDGKIVLAGYAHQNGSLMMAVVRLNADGSLDKTFGGGDAVRLIDLPNSLELALEVEALPDGDILVAGSRGLSGSYEQDWVLARLNYDGSSDREFGGSGNGALDGPGHVITAFSADGSRLARPEAMMIQPDGNMVLAGLAADSRNKPAMLARYHAQAGRPRVQVTPLALGRQARVRITAIDPATSVEVTLMAGRTRIAGGSASLQGTGTRMLRLPLTPAGRRLVAGRKKLTVTATLIASDGSGKRAQHQATRTLDA